MKLQSFSTLDAVLRGGSFAAAAAEANLTPGAVSLQMKQLEAWLGQSLFDRSGLQVRPKPLAHDVAAIMRNARTALDALRKHPAMTAFGILKLGVIDSMQPIVLPGTMLALRERHPDLDLRPARGRSATLTAAVKAGELDAALVAQPEGGGSARLRWTPMLRRELLLLAPPAATDSTAAGLFRQYDWIRYDRQTVTGALVTRYVNEHFPERHGHLEFDDTAAIVAMVSAGLGVSILQIADPSLLRRYPVRSLRLGRGAPVLQLSLVSRKADDESRALAALREAIRSTLAVAQRER